LDLVESQLLEELTQEVPRPLLRVLANPSDPSGAMDVVGGVLAHGLFYILVVGTQQAGVALDDLRLGVVQVGVRGHFTGRSL
jgi:hypothetical protein